MFAKALSFLGQRFFDGGFFPFMQALAHVSDCV